MTLHFDIFAILLELLDSKADVNALMLTSKDIYAAGARRLLQFLISIPDDRRLVSLCQFILRDTSRRAPHLRQLHICIPLKLRYFEEEYHVYQDDPELRGAPLLVCMLEHATRLKDLSIDWCEELLERDDRLVSTIAALSTLESLRVSSFGLLSCELLRTARSQFRALEVDCWMYDISSRRGHSHKHDELPLPQLLDTIHAHSETLQSLVVWFSQLGTRHTARDWCQAIRFPGMHTLSLRNVVEINQDFLVRTFPNLRRLDATDVWPGIDLEDLHEANLAGPSWADLDDVSGDADALYALGLSCSVTCVDVICPTASDNTRRRLHQLLEGTGPTHLLLHLGYSREKDEEDEEDEPEDDDSEGGLGDLLNSFTLTQNITHLALDISLNVQTRENYPDLLTLLLDILSAYTSLTFLVIRLDTTLANGIGHEPEFGDSDLSSVIDHRGCFSPFVHPMTCAQHLAGEILSLVHVSIQIKGGAPAAFWRVHRTGDQCLVETIGLVEGRSLVESEGLEFRSRTAEPSRFFYDPQI